MKPGSLSDMLGARVVSLAGQLIPPASSGRLLVLIYHRVHAERDPMFPGEVDRATFDWQMALLRRFCSPVRLEESLAALMAGTLPARAVAVTFDDGYADNAEVALPVLESHGISATFFIAPAFLDGGRMWNDSIVEAIRAHTDPSCMQRHWGWAFFLLEAILRRDLRRAGLSTTSSTCSLTIALRPCALWRILLEGHFRTG